jgi:hypothetical protein
MADSVPIEVDKHELGVEKLKFSPLADNPALVLPVEIGFNGTPVPDRVFCWREFFRIQHITCRSSAPNEKAATSGLLAFSRPCPYGGPQFTLRLAFPSSLLMR